MKTRVCKAKLSLIVVASLAAAAAANASAQSLDQCVRQTAKCAGDAVNAQLSILSAAGTAIEFTVKHPHCVADIVSSNFVTIGVSAAMTGLGITDPYGSAARPLVSAVAEVLPVAPLKNLLRDYGDETIGSALKSTASLIPVVSANPLTATLDGQLGCGSAVASVGQHLIADVKKVVGSVKSLGQSCSAAASCFTGVLLEVVKDPIGAVGSAANWTSARVDDALDAVNPWACTNISSETYMNARIVPQVNSIAYQTVWAGADYAAISENRRNVCVASYKNCDSQDHDANRRCKVMIDGTVQSDGNAWNVGKGLHQRVGYRQLEIGIPKMLRLEFKSVMNENFAVRNTLIANRQWDALLPEIRQGIGPIVLATSSVAKRAESIEKILGLKGVSSDGKFPEDAAIALSGGVGKSLQSMVANEGPKVGVLWSDKFGQMYKQIIKDRNALLDASDAELEAQIIDNKRALYSQRGASVNEAVMQAQASKMGGRMKDCADTHKGAKDNCVKGIVAAVEAVMKIMPNMGKSSNFAGLGAMGADHPAYKNYVRFMRDADATVDKLITQSKIAKVGETPDVKGVALGGQSVGGSAAPRVDAVAPSVGVAQPAANIANNVNTNQPPAVVMPQASPAANLPAPSVQVITPPKPSVAIAAPVGMPGTPGMIAAAPRPAPAPLVVNTPPAPPAGVTLQAAAPAAAPSVFVPPPSFNETLYRSSRRQAMDKEWLAPCKSDIDCQRDVNGLLREWLDAEVARIKADTTILSNTTRLAALQDSLEGSYEARIKQEWPKSVPTAVAPSAIPKEIPKTLNTTNPTNTPPPGIRR